MGEATSTIPENVINADLPCQKCGYNLRTLPMRGRCPECGEPVEESYRLSLAENFRWQRLRRGALMLALSPWGNLAVIIVMLNSRAQEPDLYLSAVWMSPHLLMHAVRAAGILMIAGSRPGKRSPAQKLCMALGVALAIFWLLLVYYTLSMAADLRIAFSLLSVIFLIEGILTISADRWVRTPAFPFRVERYAKIRPWAFHVMGYPLIGASAALLAMATIPGLESSWTGVDLGACIWIAFLASRAVHVFFWLLIADIVSQRVPFLQAGGYNIRA